MEMEKHVNILGIINIVFGFMGLIGSSIVLVIFIAGGVLANIEGGQENVMALVVIIGTIISGIIIITALPSIIAGFGLLKYKSWARILAVVVAALNLFNFPLGTGLSIYTFWVLFNDETIRLFEFPKSTQTA